MIPGQITHDLKHPDDSPLWIESSEYANWIEDAAKTICEGDDIVIDGKRYNEPVYQLSDWAAEQAVKKYNAGDDEDGMIGQLIISAIAGKAGCAARCARLLVSRDALMEKARELVEPLAEKYRESLEDDGYDD